MKGKRCYLGSLIWIWIASSCVWEKADEYNWRNNAGKQAFDYVESQVSLGIWYYDMALKLNAYLSVPPEHRPQAEDFYFPEYKIRPGEENEWLGIRDEQIVFKIRTDGRSLHAAKALWKVCRYEGEARGEMRIESQGAGKWEIKTGELNTGPWVSMFILEIENAGEGIPESFLSGHFLVTGSGKSITQWGEKIKMDFETVGSMRHLPGSRYIFNEGIWDIRAWNPEERIEAVIRGELTILPGDKRSLRIVYKGREYFYSYDLYSVP